MPRTTHDPAALELGARVTHYLWSDADVYDVTGIAGGGKTLMLRECKATLMNGPTSGEPDAMVVTPGGFAAHWSGRPRWKIESNPAGRVLKATYREKIGCWKPVGHRTNSPGGDILPGSHYSHDFNF